MEYRSRSNIITCLLFYDLVQLVLEHVPKGPCCSRGKLQLSSQPCIPSAPRASRHLLFQGHVFRIQSEIKMVVFGIILCRWLLNHLSQKIDDSQKRCNCISYHCILSILLYCSKKFFNYTLNCFSSSATHQQKQSINHITTQKRKFTSPWPCIMWLVELHPPEVADLGRDFGLVRS